MPFHADLAIGRQGEAAVAAVLTAARVRCRPSGNRKTDLQCELDGARFAVEVKFDRLQARTGNVAIEYRNTRSGRPSGLLASEADVWAVVLADGGVHLTLTAVLREFFHATSGRDVEGGDDNSAMRLYPSGLILPLFQRVDDMPSPAVRRWLKDVLAL
jgi:hypothetical protein